MDLMNENEALTRIQKIDKHLLDAGWNVDNLSHVTKELDIWVGVDPEAVKTKYSGHLFADYALLGKDGKPLAVVEAKRTSIDAEVGKEQARNYAEKIQKTLGGPMPLVFYTNGYDIFYWDTDRYPPRKVYGYPTRSDLERIHFLRDNSRPMGEELIDTEVAGRGYQIQAIRSVLESIQKKRRKFLLVMATGTGKTRTCMALLDVLMRTNWVQRVLFLVDRIALGEQAMEAFKEHLPNASVWPKQGETKFDPNRRVYVSTYPTMLNIIEQENCSLTPHFFDIIVADESHRSIYNVYKNIFDYFDTIQLGLTATPKDHIDHNTFKLFECDEGLPTFAYTYEEAVNNVPPYLSDFEVLKIKTRFQQEGINSQSIAAEDKKRLLSEGRDPDGYDFEGTELEKKVSNRGTNTLIIREFMEESIKDPNGVLPWKTIMFAMSKKHAYRLCEVLNTLYPEYKGQLAEVMISDIKGVYGKGGLLDRLKNNDMPRIAISVDMLDTGIDVREIVNLVFAKPVFSYSKFWQMIGRGTRVLEPKKIKPWCPTKDKFLVMDCWENFDYFKMNPKGKDPNQVRPLPVRIFEARLTKLELALERGAAEIALKMRHQLQDDLNDLPYNSVIVKESIADIQKVKDPSFWNAMKPDDFVFLRHQIAPVMRAKSNSDFKAMRFELDILELSTAKLANDTDAYQTLRDGAIETISSLPLSVNVVAAKKDWIEKAKTEYFWSICTDTELDELVQVLGPLMKFIETNRPSEVKTDLKDLLTVKEYVEFGPENERMSMDKYKQRVEELVQQLVKTNPVLQKLINGDPISEEEIHDLSYILSSQHPQVTEENLQKIYDNRRAKFIQFMRHILGIEPMATFTETVSGAFDSFIREHNSFSGSQIQFLQILRNFILQKGSVEKKDLVQAPFTQLHPQGIRGIFKAYEIDEILSLVGNIAA